MSEAAAAIIDIRECTCHPDDAPVPCQRKFSTNHCWRAAVYEETRENIIILKNMDRDPIEQQMLDYFMRIERALDGSF